MYNFSPPGTGFKFSAARASFGVSQALALPTRKDEAFRYADLAANAPQLFPETIRSPAFIAKLEHDALLALDGHYAALWRHQSGGFLPERLPESA